MLKKLETLLPINFGADDLTLAGICSYDFDADKKAKREYEQEQKKDKPDKKQLYNNSAMNGYEPSCNLLIQIYNKHWKESTTDMQIQKNYEKCLKAGVNAGSEEAMKRYAEFLYNKGMRLEDKKQFNEAFESFSKSLDYFELPECQYAISNYYATPTKYGKIVKQNMYKAVDYVKTAALSGYNEAECKLGRCYLSGIKDVLPKDEELAQKYLQRAADKGNAEALYELSMLGIKKAAEKGYKRAIMLVKCANDNDAALNSRIQ